MRGLPFLLPLGVLLAGCTLVAGEPTETPVASSSDFSWDAFPHCPGGPETDWVRVAGFPTAEIEATEIRPDCGDTWTTDGGEHFTNVTALAVTDTQLDAFGVELSGSGYDKLVDDFQPADAGGPAVLVGARDYYLDGIHDGDFTRVAIEIYSNGTDPQTYTAFIDYLSPETRALAD
jgi:hypothetical protein